MLPEKEKRVCPYSKTEFLPRRNNQIFASKEFRVAFHNEKHNLFRRKISPINKELTNCNKVMLEILGDKTSAIVHQEFLNGKNFSFSVFTSIKKIGDGYAYAIYDCYYYKTDIDHFKIVKI